MPTLPQNCLNCGVCCFSKSGTYVRVTDLDWERLGEEASFWVRQVGKERYLRMEEGRCRALRITTRRGDAAYFFCEIYERRPQVCRDLARGGPACWTELRAKGDRLAAVFGPRP